MKVVPDLCETIDYAEVQGVLFPRVAARILTSSHCLPMLTESVQLVFTKTRILSVKVATLITFLSMVKTLDQVKKFSLYAPPLSLTQIIVEFDPEASTSSC